MAELHGFSLTSDKNSAIRHEAGHLILYWLLDRTVAGVCAEEGGGLVHQVSETNEPAMPYQHLLVALAGMVGENNFRVYDELCAHTNKPTWFVPNSDSYHAACAVSLLPGNPQENLMTYHKITQRLLQRFSLAHKQTIRQLKNGMIDLVGCYNLFGEWDLKYGFDKRPKSDMLCRTIARFFHFKVPRAGFLNYDFKPLPDGWTYKRPTLLEVAMSCKAEMSRRLK